MEPHQARCQRFVLPAATGSHGDRIGEQPKVQANRRPSGRKGSPMLTLFLYLQSRRDDEGVTAVEYALIAALVAVAIILAVTFLGGAISGTFKHVGSAVSSGS
jgi:pilus assembly protein Flp/PilA